MASCADRRSRRRYHGAATAPHCPAFHGRQPMLKVRKEAVQGSDLGHHRTASRSCRAHEGIMTTLSAPVARYRLIRRRCWWYRWSPPPGLCAVTGFLEFYFAASSICRLGMLDIDTERQSPNIHRRRLRAGFPALVEGSPQRGFVFSQESRLFCLPLPRPSAIFQSRRPFRVAFRRVVFVTSSGEVWPFVVIVVVVVVTAGAPARKIHPRVLKASLRVRRGRHPESRNLVKVHRRIDASVMPFEGMSRGL